MEDEHGFINIVVPGSLVAKFVDVVKFAPFIVVEGRVEREDAAINVIGWRFRELRVRDTLSHMSHDFH